MSNIAKNRIWQYVLTALLLIAGFVVLRQSSWQGNTQLHTIMEVIATVLALLVGAMALVRYYTQKHDTFLFIGAGFLGTGFLDGYHAVVTSTFFNQIWPSAPESLIPWSWNASRTFLSVIMVISFWACRKEQEDKHVNPQWVYTAIGLLTLASFLFFAFFPLPKAYYPGFFLGRPEELISASFFLMALIGYLKKGQWKTDGFEHWLVLSLIVGFLGQACFMSSSFQLFDAMFDAAHLLKKTTYICVLSGLLISMFEAYRKVEEQIGLIKDKQNQLIQSEKLSSVGTLVAGVSHELTNPLMGLQNYIQYCKKNTDSSSKIFETLNDALHEVNRCHAIVRNLLTFSRMEKEGVEDLQQVHCSELFDRVFGLVSYRLENEKINLIKNWDKNISPIKGRSNQLQQVFLNLIVNAMDALEKSQKKEIEVAIRANGQHIEVSVKDSGAGISEELQQKILDPFYTTKAVGKGTGLGLSVSKGIVEAHGGTLSWKSQVGEGTEFLFTLRIKRGGVEVVGGRLWGVGGRG